MDRRDSEAANNNDNANDKGSTYEQIYVNDGGKHYHVPYDIIRQVVFSGIKKEEMQDLPHAARLQYRLMLLDSVIKARVDFTKSKITIIYNPSTAHNSKPKISLNELVEVLKKEGINVNSDNIEDKDFDYKSFYTYAFDPAMIRERLPYTYSKDEWEKIKPGLLKKKKEAAIKKVEKFHEWQKRYAEEHGNIVY